MTTRSTLPSILPPRPIAVLLGAVTLAVTAGLLSAQQPAKPAAKNTPAPASPAKPPAVPASAAKAAPVAVVVTTQISAAPVSNSGSEKEEPTASLIQGDLIYKHLGEPDPFWPPPVGCKKDDKNCQSPPPDAKGCKKYKLEEMILTGITDTNGLKVAMLSAENKPYFVKAGDHCRDAQVLEVDVKTTCVKWRVVIPQSENNIRPYKDVTSCLKAQAPR